MRKCRYRGLATPIPLITALGEEEVVLPESYCLPGMRLMMTSRILPRATAAAPDQ
jgi:hypothetical protein